MVQVEDRKAGAEALVREGEEFVRYWRDTGDGGPLLCCVDHPDAGGRCGRDAVMMVYDLLFCEVYGAEAKAGCLEELYNNAEQYLDFFEGAEHVRGMNP